LATSPTTPAPACQQPDTRLQFVLTIPRVLRGIFRKRRHLLTLLFKTATETLQEIFRTRLNLPTGHIGAVAAVHTSREKITWNATTKTVIYRSKRHHNTKRNFEIFKAPIRLRARLVRPTCAP
jgi:hypothetical protein